MQGCGHDQHREQSLQQKALLSKVVGGENSDDANEGSGEKQDGFRLLQ